MLLFLAFFAMAAGEIAVLSLGETVSENAYRTYHLLQMVFLIGISFRVRTQLSALRTRQLSDGAWNKVASLIQIGLTFSFIGDLINSGLVDLQEFLKPQVLLSVPFFAVAHVVYIRSYFIQTAILGSRTLYLWIAWPVAAVLLWKGIVDPSKPLIVYLSLPYAFMVCLMALSSIRMPLAWGFAGVSVTFGAFLFLFSDSLIGWSLTKEPARWLSQMIWSTYYTAQILILRSLYLAKR